MSIRNVEAFFNPGRIAVIGASEDPGSIGYLILRNMIGKGYKGVVYPVNSSRESVQGIQAYKSLSDISHPVDLAIAAVSTNDIPSTLEECGGKGVKGVSVICPDFEGKVKNPKILESEIRRLSSQYGFRVIGPNTLGFIRPGINLNASIFPKIPRKGNIALISQSATLSAALLDRAVTKNVGFSYIVSIGTKPDLGFSDLIDFLGVDPETKAIILYLDHIQRGRKFITAVRSFARSKPIVVVKSGKFDVSAQIALTHSGFLAGEDKVYDAAFKRAGAVRIDEILDLFYIVETLAKQRRPNGKRLAIVTNAGAPAVLAVDALLRLEGELAELSEETVGNLTRELPMITRARNPVNLFTDASPACYQTAIRHCLKDGNVDGLLVLHVPFFGSAPLETAQAVVDSLHGNPPVPLFTVWMGDELVLSAREYLNSKGIPTFVTPEQAVRSFIYMYRYDYNLQLLQETPEAILQDFTPDRRKAVEICRRAFEQKRVVLDLNETREILQAYGIPLIAARRVESEEEAVRASEDIGFPVVLKIDSQKIIHKLEKGGVILNVKDNSSVQSAFWQIRKLATETGDPEAHVIVQPMIVKHGFELAIGAKKDPTFGSVILFGTGGELLEAVGDYAIGLPPLNQTLARRMMEETRIYKYLLNQGIYKESLRLLEETLVRFSQILVDFPCIREIDINPFLLTGKEGLVLDAAVLIEKDQPQEYEQPGADICPPHLAICPYPFQYVREVVFEDGKSAVIRPIKPEDEPLIHDLFKSLSDETIMFRFGQLLTDMPHERLVRYCQIDYDRELAFVAVVGAGHGNEKIIADVRVIRMPDLETAELAILVSDDWQGHGIGTMLMDYCIEIAAGSGVNVIWMEILKNNTRMLHLSRSSGFKPVYDDGDMVKVLKQVGKKG
jgi:acetyltransferase